MGDQVVLNLTNSNVSIFSYNYFTSLLTVVVKPSRKFMSDFKCDKAMRRGDMDVKSATSFPVTRVKGGVQ